MQVLGANAIGNAQNRHLMRRVNASLWVLRVGPEIAATGHPGSGDAPHETWALRQHDILLAGGFRFLFFTNIWDGWLIKPDIFIVWLKPPTSHTLSNEIVHTCTLAPIHCERMLLWHICSRNPTSYTGKVVNMIARLGLDE